MRKVLMAFCLLFSGPVLADGQPVSMWLVEGEANRVYMLGSVHLLRRQDHPLPQIMEEAYQDAEALIMELDMDDLDPAALQAATNRMGLLDAGVTLEDVIGEEAWATALAAAEEIRIPLDMMSQSEPWLAAITIEQLILMRLGFNPLYGIELHMTTQAIADGKPITGLETAEEQLGFFDNMSVEAQTDLLMQTLTERQDSEQFMDQMVAAWRRGDVDYLEETMLAEMEDFEELYATIVVDRNRRWVDEIVELLDDPDDYLIVVGALHMVGDDGVPTLLAQRGIEVEQMQDSSPEGTVE
ncbi:MAG: TraB/GumN family protein [Woeseiaceae bacterium]|nr:TraB/GumN family protein [Woeseiaceae bacterium]